MYDTITYYLLSDKRIRSCFLTVDKRANWALVEVSQLLVGLS